MSKGCVAHKRKFIAMTPSWEVNHCRTSCAFHSMEIDNMEEAYFIIANHYWQFLPQHKIPSVNETSLHSQTDIHKLIFDVPSGMCLLPCYCTALHKRLEYGIWFPLRNICMLLWCTGLSKI